MPEQLLWGVDAPEEELRPRSTIYQAPSWSWAAVNLPVREVFAFGSFRYHYAFLVDLTRVEARSFDMVVDQGPAQIQLSGMPFNACFVKKAPPSKSVRYSYTLETATLEHTEISVYLDHFTLKRLCDMFTGACIV